MSVSQRFFGALSNTFHSRSPFSYRISIPFRSFSPNLSRSSFSPLTIPRKQRQGASKEHRWVEKSKVNELSASLSASSLSASWSSSNAGKEAAMDRVAEDPVLPLLTPQFGSIGVMNHVPGRSQKSVWKPKSYGTISGATTVGPSSAPADQMTGPEHGKQTESSGAPAAVSSKLFREKLLESFTTDRLTYSRAQVRATFYPKFENEKSDQEVRTRMIEMVSKGLATMEVSLKHSGSLFMYAGHEGGAYAKNSYGNIYTAVGVFVLGRMFREAWGPQASKKQAEFNEFLERNRMCVSMELVTAVLGDHGQRPHEDYVVVTAVTELGNGKPKFYSTPALIAFCRNWRLPTNHVWLFSTRKSVMSFFAAYDALSEEGTATTVCKTLDEVADISIPGSKDHIMVQGEILEGLVARIVSQGSSEHMKQVLRDHPPPPTEGVDLGSSLREICAANRTNEKQQIMALLKSVGTSFCPNYMDWFGTEASDSQSRNADRSVLSKFLQTRPADFSTTKLQEIVRLMREKRYPAAFKFYHNFHKADSTSNDSLHFKMVIHVHSDLAFRKYQKEMRINPGLWPLYRGFFVDLNLFKVNEGRSVEFPKKASSGSELNGESAKDDLADEDANLMIKLKFLTYKIRTFLIRNGLSVLFKQGETAYKTYYMRQMKIWNTSPAKQRQLSKMLDEWAVYIHRKYGHKQLPSSTYLSEAEPFLEQYAKRSSENQALIGSAGSFVRVEDFMAMTGGGQDEEGDLEPERDMTPSSPSPMVKETVAKDHGLIVFFPGIPGCAKSALCKEIMSSPGRLGDDRPVKSLMGDLIKARYWVKVDQEYRKKPYSIMLADKNAPNEEVWRKIEDMCRSTGASGVPIIPDSEGTESNPFSLDSLSVFIFRVLHRANHPGNLDNSSPNAGYVLLMFYNLYEGKDRKEFETELIERFGSIVKMPLLEPKRPPLPESVRSVLEEGLSLYKLHCRQHGKLDSTKGQYAKEWTKWEKQLRDTLSANADYLNSIQVPFGVAVEKVIEQLQAIAKADYSPPSTEKRNLGAIVFAAVTLPISEIIDLIHNLGMKDPRVESFFKDKDLKSSLKNAHLTLAHKRSHGVTALASFAPHLNQNIPVAVSSLLFSDKLAALEADPGVVDGEKIDSKNEWPHVTLWTAQGVAAKEANALPQLLAQGKATRVEINPPTTVTGVLQFF
ncbi:tRNA ligase 1-like isoform X1 [Salvia splendens]|uniref:tRNA ligase 1-like isoform X1 n=1 Tax=Salvia splendens TaxID=180675 RepID=UPI001C2703A2|nr:tRNA ligase 1-like isoform X1 [Salvia splendens]